MKDHQRLHQKSPKDKISICPPSYRGNFLNNISFYDFTNRSSFFSLLKYLAKGFGVQKETSLLNMYGTPCIIYMTINLTASAHQLQLTFFFSSPVGGCKGMFSTASHCWSFDEAQNNKTPDKKGGSPAILQVQLH